MPIQQTNYKRNGKAMAKNPHAPTYIIHATTTKEVKLLKKMLKMLMKILMKKLMSMLMKLKGTVAILVTLQKNGNGMVGMTTRLLIKAIGHGNHP